MTALLKGGAVHSILEVYPEKSSHKLAPQYQHIVDVFVRSHLGEKYLTVQSTREFDFGLTSDLTPTKYSDKKALFRGSVDFICVIDGVLYDEIEVDSLDDIPEGWELDEILEKDSSK